MDIQMKNILNIITFTLFIASFQGCGSSSEPQTYNKDEIYKEEDNEVDDTKVQTEEKTEIQIEKNELNSTMTHIRVLEFDQRSRIPEHLVKIPIYQDQ